MNVLRTIKDEFCDDKIAQEVFLEFHMRMIKFYLASCSREIYQQILQSTMKRESSTS